MNRILNGWKAIPVRGWAVATVLVAFFLRVYRLADKNIWWDEGWSLWLSQKTPTYIALRTAADEHPPLHYGMLSLWNTVAGTDAFAGRFLSACFGVLTVALVYRLGKKSGGAAAGVCAALFLALARFHIWWSQDIKNYTPSILFAFAALWFALDLLAGVMPCRTSRRASASPAVPWKPVLGYALCAALALWTHYLAALVLVGVNIYAAILFLLQWPALLGRTGPGNRDTQRNRDTQGDRDAQANRDTQGDRVGPGNRDTQGDRVGPGDRDTQGDRVGSGDRDTQGDRVGSGDHKGQGDHKGSPQRAGDRVAQGDRAGRVETVHATSLRSTLAIWIAAQLLGAALFVPWLYLYLQNAAAWSAAPAFDFGVFVKLVATVLPLGVTTHIDDYAALTLALTAVAAVPVIRLAYAAFRRRSFAANGALLFALIVLVPPVLIYALSLTPVAFFAPKVQARYLLVLLPAYSVLLALGVAALRRISPYLGVAAAGLVILASVGVLHDYYAERRLADDYATLANTINAFAQPDDLVLLDTDQEWPTLLYYLRAPLEWLGVPNGAGMNATNAEALVQRALARHDAVWLVAIPDALATDPQRLLEATLTRERTKQYEASYGDKRLVLYAPAARDLVQVPARNFEPQHRRLAASGGGAQLLGFDLPVREAQVGDTLRLVTYWNAAQPAAVTLGVSPTMRKTVTVPAGERVRVETDFVLAADAVGDAAVALGDQNLARVRVEPRAGAGKAGAITHPLTNTLGEPDSPALIDLAGYDLPATRMRAGESLSLTLYWRARRPVDKGYVVFVHLLGEQFNPAQDNLLWGQIDRVPRAGSYPTTAWTPDQVVSDPYNVPVDPRAPAGKYQIEIGMYDPSSGTRLVDRDGRDSVIISEIELTAGR